MEITLEGINSSDQLLIKTQNSEYRFSVVDPSERKGTLSGGSLGEQKREAVLVGSLSDNNGSFSNISAGLKTGKRALFYLTARNGIERLITSIITGISRGNQREEDKRAA
jgi:hypothetical protein